MISEKLLQFIWQFGYFNQKSLSTNDGEEIQILSRGVFNQNQGPDFLNAKIKIGNTIWAGNVELHINSSDWVKHHHQHDKNYKNVILHVVWNHVQNPKKELIPILELQNKVSSLLINRYEKLMLEKEFIFCENQLPALSEIGWISWKERLATERCIRKSEIILQEIKNTKLDWENTFWTFLSKSLGGTVNGEAFYNLAQSLPQQILVKHKNSLLQIEGLLFGQAQLLEGDVNDSYYLALKKEYKHLKNKYQLNPIQIPLHFLRMRPNNFPTIRLAQLAMLVLNSNHLFSKIKEASSVKEVEKFLVVNVSSYWVNHYQFNVSSVSKNKKIGATTVQNILINTIVPILFAYGISTQNQDVKDKAIQWLQELKPEKNSIITQWEELKIQSINAMDTQALLELKTQYCQQKKCLQCAVGLQLLKSTN